MPIDNHTPTAVALVELGRRLAGHRLARNWTQAELAAEAGVGQATVQRAERGHSVQATSLVKLLRALGLLGNLDAAVPEPGAYPIAQLEREQRRDRSRARRRARRRPSAEPPAQPWRWGEELGAPP
jgi:transcriptional regulator with XRE-family HTH domain